MYLLNLTPRGCSLAVLLHWATTRGCRYILRYGSRVERWNVVTNENGQMKVSTKLGRSRERTCERRQYDEPGLRT
jgi:hypothetical protein